MNEIIPIESIENKIYLIRGQKVILDKDLAALYSVKTRVLNQAVKRKVDRFPEDFMFSLSKEEILRMSQIVTSYKYSKNINAFTEQGIAMLSGLLNSKRAIHVNIAIMRAFVKLRNMLLSHKEFAQKLKELEQKYEKHDAEIHSIFNAIRRIMSPPEKSNKKYGFQTDRTKNSE